MGVITLLQFWTATIRHTIITSNFGWRLGSTSSRHSAATAASTKSYASKKQGCLSPSFFVQLNPFFHDQFYSFTGHVVANPTTHFTSQKKERGIWPKCKTIRKYNGVFFEQKRTICSFKCWLNCHLASFEALLSLEKKKHRRSNAIVERGPFFASCRTKTIIRQIAQFPMFFSITSERHVR